MNSQESSIFYKLEYLRKQSLCLDKRVACIITTKRYKMLSSGINVIIVCDMNCLDKERRVCVTRHAEVEAIESLPSGEVPHYAFLSLFPCTDCQGLLTKALVKEIVVFGKRHKEQVFSNIRLEERPK